MLNLGKPLRYIRTAYFGLSPQGGSSSGLVYRTNQINKIKQIKVSVFSIPTMGSITFFCLYYRYMDGHEKNPSSNSLVYIDA